MSGDAWVLRTDGGSRGNPGPAAAAFVLDDETGTRVCDGGRYLGSTTNNVAEYEALVWGLDVALTAGARRLEVYSDSELLVRQINGSYKVKHPNMIPLYRRACELLERFDAVHVSHVRREENKEADALANEAMDARTCVGCAPDTETSPGGQGSLFASEPVEVPSAAEAGTVARSVTPVTAARPVSSAVAAATAPSVAPAVTAEAQKGRGVYELTVKGHFDAAHALRGYPGECRELHGHTWDVEVTVAAEALDEIGIVYDFKRLKQDLAEVLDRYDHAYLNEIPPFDELSPTAENLARVVFDELEAVVDPSVRVVEVAVWESPIAKLAYRR